MAISSAERFARSAGFFPESNDLIQLAERHVVIAGHADPIAVADKYGIAAQQQTIGGYAIQDAQELGSYLDQAGTLTAEDRARLEERVISEGSVFRESAG